MKKGVRSSFWSQAALVMASLIWGVAFVVMKSALGSVPPMLLLAFRFTIAAAILGTAFFHRIRRMLNARMLRRGLGCGLILGAAYIVQTLGLMETTPGKNAFLTAVYCVLVPFIAWIWMKRRPVGGSFAAALICLAGIGLISVSEQDAASGIAAGDALSLLSGVIFAVQVASLSRYGCEEDPSVMTVLQFVSAGLLCWACVFLRGERFVRVTWPMVWDIAYLAVFSTALALLLQNIGQSGTPPALSGILLSLESVFAVAAAVLFAGEVVTLRLAAGFALVFIAVLISAKSAGTE